MPERRGTQSGHRNRVLRLGPWALAVALCLSAPARARAQRPAYVPIDAMLRLEEGYTDNLQQQPGPDREGDFFTEMMAQLDWLGPWRKVPTSFTVAALGKIYANADEFDYFQAMAQGSARYGRTDALLRYAYSPQQLLFTQEDGGPGAFYHENVFEAALRRRFLSDKRLRLQLGFTAEWNDFVPEFDDRDSFNPGTELAARYDIEFATLRAGVEYEYRDAERDNYKRDKLDVGAGFDLRLPWEVLLRFAYERSFRDYTVCCERDPDNRRNSNFGRNDDIHQYQVALMAPVYFVPDLLARLRFRYRDGDSNSPGRRFTVHEVGFELTYFFHFIEDE